MGKKGLFVSFEGTEGVGKSTLIQAIAEDLKRKGVPYILTREPGGSRLAEKIRELVLHEDMNPWTEVLLYEAARADHVGKTIMPALDKGQIVLCDRYTDSSLAYQSHARGLSWKWVNWLNDLATQGLRPDLTVFLDVDPAIGLSRAKDRNRFENEGLQFQRKVYKGFLKAKKTVHPKRWFSLKARSDSPEVLAQHVVERILKKWSSKK